MQGSVLLDDKKHAYLADFGGGNPFLNTHTVMELEEAAGSLHFL